MKKILSKRSFMFLSILIFVLIFSTACSNENEDLLEDFNNSIWRSNSEAIEFSIVNNTININQVIKPDMDPEDFNLDGFDQYKDILGLHENMSIKRTGKNLRIYNNDKLDLEFKIISENEIEDKDGNIFNKR